MPDAQQNAVRERLSVLQQQWPIVLWANIVNALIVGAVLSTAGDMSRAPVLWAALVIALTIVRWWWSRGQWRGLGEGDPRPLLRFITIGAGLSGTLWGVGLAAMLPEDPILQVLISFVLGGMGAGAAVSLASHLPAMYAFLLPGLLPLALRFLIEGTAVYAAMGWLLMVFCFFLSMIGRNLNSGLVRALALQSEKDELVLQLKGVLANLEQRVAERTQSLCEMNARLAMEISERERAERAERVARREAEQANDAKSRFLAAASHDLRQPLQAMRLYYELLGRLSQEPKAQGAVVRLGEAMDATERLLAALMDISTLDAGTVVVNAETFPIQEVLDRLTTEIEPQVGGPGIHFRVRPSPHKVVSDPVLLTRILRNLLTNAVRHAGGGGILVGCRRRGAALRIEVWDRGPGVPHEQSEAIFNDFVRLDEEQTADRGLGLGLGIVKRMAVLLGHRVGLRSWPGRGSVFYVDVPLATE